jgi:exopolysaccharide biosynthesis polyprenyl glycosylphosphotransferase
MAVLNDIAVDTLPPGIVTPLAGPAFGSDVQWSVPGRSLAVSERRILLVVLDVLVLLAVGYALSLEHIGPGSSPGLALLFAVPWVVFAQLSGLYDLATASRGFALLRSFGAAISMYGVALLAYYFLFVAKTYGHPTSISKPNFMILMAAPAAIGIWRLAYLRLFGAAHFQRKVLVVGAGSASATLLRAVRENDGHGVNVVGLLDDGDRRVGSQIEGVPVLGDSTLMWPLVANMGVEEVVLAINQPSRQSLYEGLGICYEHGIAVSMMPKLYEEVTGQVPVEHMGPHWFGSVQLGRSGGGVTFAMKRLIDIAASTVMAILTLPLALVIAVLVKATSRGPVFHIQERVGLHGRAFRIVKFRTMRTDAEAAGRPVWALRHDPRATGLGHWLRRMHLDELPQFWLVMKGDMSLVGPRPERPEFVSELEAAIPLYRARYSMRPGIAGWAQINYPYGASVEDALAKLRYDLYYVKNWSPVLDVAIMIRTVARVLGFRGR